MPPVDLAVHNVGGGPYRRAMGDNIEPQRRRLEPTTDYGRTQAEIERRLGLEPNWLRVWRDGKDVTHEDPATWPWPWNPDAPRPGGRRNRSRRH